MMHTEDIICRQNGEIRLWRQWLDQERQGQLFDQLKHQPNWHSRWLTIFGRRVREPRLSLFVGDPGISYRYSGLQRYAARWPEPLPALRGQLNRLLSTGFNCCLINYYRDGNDSIAWHADNELELGSQPCIASLSLGAERRFRLRQRGSAQVLTVMLRPGDLLVMSGETQRYWQHSVPKMKAAGPRINLTFRSILSGSRSRK